jgi:hypothetical protein
MNKPALNLEQLAVESFAPSAAYQQDVVADVETGCVSGCDTGCGFGDSVC